ncbi:MAG: hypothetical protein KAR23_01480, partial [Candidatus Aenigmarchaeota archaeon]|nr:hypothetical protein [Candidatus Aenigmarchaeota archaeon]
NGTEAFTNLTDAQGNIQRQILTEYIHTPSGMDYTDYNNYTVHANLSGYTNATQEINLTESKSVYLTLGPACGTLDTADKVYTLISNVSSDGTCFTIGANNITLDGNGYTINYSQTSAGNAINDAGGYDDLTIKDCEIFQGGNSANSNAIHIVNSDYAIIYNNTIETNDDSATDTKRGVYLDNSDYANISKNTINTYSDLYTEGIYATFSYNLSITNNTITTEDEFSPAIYLSGSNTANSGTYIGNNVLSSENYVSHTLHLYYYSYATVYDNNMTISGSGETSALSIFHGRYNNISKNILTSMGGNSAYGLIFDNAKENTVVDTVIDANGEDDVLVKGSNDFTNYLINSTFNQSKAGFLTSTDKIKVQWYLDVYVNDSVGGAVESANVTAWQNNGTESFTNLTDASGNIQRQILTEYTQNMTAKYYTDYNNYTVNATKGSTESTAEVNLTGNKAIYFTISGVTSCDTLSDADTTYTLLGNVSSDGTCFSIGANNITIDCNGYTINYSQTSAGYGVYISGKNDTTVKNCNIVQGSSSGDA